MPYYYLTTREGLAEAIRLAHRALRLESHFGAVATLAGLCHMQNVVLGYTRNPSFDREEAIRLVHWAMSIDYSDPETLAKAAVISAFMVGDSEAEIEIVERAVALNPNSWGVWNARGWVYNYAGLPEEAIRSFERATRMSPIDPRLYMTLTGLGQALIELRRSDEAIVVLKKALRQNVCNSGTYRCLASAFAHLGRDTEAYATAARVLEMDPAFTISTLIDRVPKNSRLFIEGLRKAGLPE
jgi:adenylate cyclase